MFVWIRRRSRSSKFHSWFITDTVNALDLLHRRMSQIEGQLREQQATNRELASHTARAEAEASVARLEVRDLIKQYSAIGATRDGGQPERTAPPAAERPPELLDSLMPILTPIRSKREITERPRGGGEHLCLLQTPDGYELLEVLGAAPAVRSVVDLGEGRQGEVAKVAPSPLPNDKRRCAYLLPAATAVKEDEPSPMLVGSW